MNLRPIALLALAAICGTLRAENEENIAPDTVAIDEIRVTAIKQARSLLREPVTVTTLRAAELERADVVGLKGVSEMAPNFFMPDYGSRMTSSVYIRGIGARIDQAAVGLNVDNVPYLNKDAYDFDLTDIDRVEVLRGPQSTLFGRNTIAGLINIYTLSPLRQRSLRVMAEGGTHGSFRGSVSALGELAPGFGMGLSAFGSLRRGYFTNSQTGECADREKTASLRWKTAWRIIPELLLENTASYAFAHQKGYPYAFEETGEISYTDPTFYRRNAFTDGLTLTWSRPSFTLSSITSFQYLADNLTLDQDFLPLDWFNLTQRQHDRNWSQEIVARGTVGHWSWLGGAFGFLRHQNMSAPVTFLAGGVDRFVLGGVNSMLPEGMRLSWDSGDLSLLSDFTHPVQGYAFYHQSTFTYGNFILTAGLRLDYEHTVLDWRSRTQASATMWRTVAPGREIPLATMDVDIDDNGRLTNHFMELLPKISVTYNMPHSAIFASVSKGYKAGGYNVQMFSDFLQQRMMEEFGRPADYDIQKMVSYAPETSWNYEIGGHFRPDKGRVNSSFALYWIELRNQQLTVFPEGTTTGRIMTNAGRSRSLGAEFTMTYTPTSRWAFNLSYGYSHATFRRYRDGSEDYRGNRIPYAPGNTLFLSAFYRHPLQLSWLKAVSFQADFRGAGSIYWDEANLHRQNFYGQLGAQIAMELPHLTVEFWGKNLTDTKFNTFRYVSVGNSFYQSGLPVRGGITLRLTL